MNLASWIILGIVILFVGLAIRATFFKKKPFLSSTGVYEIVPGFIAGGIAAIVVTLAKEAPEKKVTDIYDEATKEGNDD